MACTHKDSLRFFHNPDAMSIPTDISNFILTECLGRPQALTELCWLCDHVGGRTSGTESGRRGEEWAAGLLERWNLNDVRFEEFPVAAWTRGALDAAVTEPVRWRMAALAHAMSPRQCDVSARVVELG